MRIGIQTWGSAGDVRPMIALAAGLRAAGHEVHLVATPVENRDYRPLCLALGVPYRQAPEVVAADLQGMVRAVRPWHGISRRVRQFFDTCFFPYVDTMYEAARELAATSDLLVAHFFLYPAKIAALKAGVPYASVAYWPAIARSPVESEFGLPNMGRTLNRLAGRVLQAVVNRAIREEVQRFWRREGLRPPRHATLDGGASETLSLLAASPTLWPPDPEWPPHNRLCGFFAIPDAVEPWEMPAPLREFLAAGPPPVYMTFGSSQLLEPEKGTELQMAAARLAGCRAILQTCSPRFPADTHDGNVYFLGPAAHRLIFPHCAAIVHHGGAGTTHSATLAGRPSIVVGFFGEQISWGRKLRGLGIAGRPLAYQWTSPRGLARAVRHVLGSPEMRPRAARLAESMRQENGVARAIQEIERVRR